MKVYYFREDIRNVTEYYYSIILSALKKKGLELIAVDKISFKVANYIERDSYILVTSLIGFFKLWLFGHRNFIYWYQGITPEEDKMITGSCLRFHLFSTIERLSLKIVKYKIGVSYYLFRHFEQKYNISLPPSDLFVMPCYNSEFKRDNFFVENKYTKNVFCFAGGMQVWQGFDDIVRLYSQIEKKWPNSFLKVYSKDKNEAKKVIEKYGVNNYILDCVSQAEVEQVLSDCKFGFIIRKDDIINNVATPTKLGTYIGNGIIPIFTPSIKAYADLAAQYNYLCCAEIDKMIDKLEPYMSSEIKPDDICDEYKKLYDNYFNKEEYINRLVDYFDI